GASAGAPFKTVLHFAGAKVRGKRQPAVRIPYPPSLARQHTGALLPSGGFLISLRVGCSLLDVRGRTDHGKVTESASVCVGISRPYGRPLGGWPKGRVSCAGELIVRSMGLPALRLGRPRVSSPALIDGDVRPDGRVTPEQAGMAVGMDCGKRAMNRVELGFDLLEVGAGQGRATGHLWLGVRRFLPRPGARAPWGSAWWGGGRGGFRPFWVGGEGFSPSARSARARGERMVGRAKPRSCTL